MMLNRRLPEITARDVCPAFPSETIHPVNDRQTCHALGRSREPPV
jgi:hypothetical protein